MALITILTLSVCSAALAASSATVNGVVYSLTHVRATDEIGDPQMGGSRANGSYIIVSLQLVNKTNHTRDVNPTACTLTDENGTKYESSDAGNTALAMSGDKNAAWLDPQVQPGVARTADIVFEVPKGARSFTLTIPAAVLSFGRSGKIDVSL